MQARWHTLINSLGCCHHDKSQVNLRKESGRRQHFAPFKPLLHPKWLKMWSKATFHIQKEAASARMSDRDQKTMNWAYRSPLTHSSTPCNSYLQQKEVQNGSNLGNYIFCTTTTPSPFFFFLESPHLLQFLSKKGVNKFDKFLEIFETIVQIFSKKQMPSFSPLKA